MPVNALAPEHPIYSGDLQIAVIRPSLRQRLYNLFDFDFSDLDSYSKFKLIVTIFGAAFTCASFSVRFARSLISSSQP